MLHELCFNYMRFHELRTKSHFYYEFKGLKLTEICKKNSTWQILIHYLQWFFFGEFLHNGDRKSPLWIVQKGFLEKCTAFFTFWGIKFVFPFVDNEFLQITRTRQDSKNILMSCLTSKFGSLTKLTKKSLVTTQFSYNIIIFLNCG
jgi:hypothetical protein